METENVEIIQNEVDKDYKVTNVTLSMKFELRKLSLGSLQDSSFRTATTKSYTYLARIKESCTRFALTLAVCNTFTTGILYECCMTFLHMQTTMSVFHTNKKVKIT